MYECKTREDYLEYLSHPEDQDQSHFELIVDWLEDLLEDKYPVWQYIHEWRDTLYTHDILTPIRPDDDFLDISVDRRPPRFPIRWPQRILQETFACVKKIIVDRTALRRLPKWIGQLPLLEELRIVEGKPISDIFVIPAWLADIPSLKILNIYCIHLKLSFTRKFCRGSRIRELHIQDAQTICSPLSDFELFPVLEHLEIGNVLDKPFFSPNNPHRYLMLRELIVSDPQTCYFLQILPTLPQLKEFTLKSGFLHEFPLELRSLSNIQAIDLRGADLMLIPNWIIELHELQGLKIAFISDPSSMKVDLREIPEYPSFLRNCPNLLWVDIPTSVTFPIRSLYGLSSLSRYWITLYATYPRSDSDRRHYHVHLPPTVYYHIHTEFIRELPPSLALTARTQPIRASIVDIYPPSFYPNVEVISRYTDETICLRCGQPLRGWKCHICNLDYNLAPKFHPQIIQFLEEYYRPSFDDLFQRVRRREKLTESEYERFLHEIDYHYWQVLLNNDLSALDPSIVDALLKKFSLPLRNGEQIML